MPEKDFKVFLENLNYEQLSNVVWHRLVNGSVPGFGNLPLQRGGYYADNILHALYGSKGETPLAIKVKKICGEHLQKIAKFPTEKMFDGKLVAPEIVAIHEFSFLSALISSATAIEPLTALYGRDFSVLPRKWQEDTLGYIAQGLAQILVWHKHLATDRQRVILESEMWKNDATNGYHLGYFQDLVLIFPGIRQELIEKLRSRGFTVDEVRLDKWLCDINPRLRTQTVNPEELRELGVSEDLIQEALKREQRDLLESKSQTRQGR